MADQMSGDKKENPLALPDNRKSFFWRLFSSIRFFAYIAVLLFMLGRILPIGAVIQDIPKAAGLPIPLTILGFLVVFMIIATIFTLFLTPRNTLAAPTLGLESVVIVVIGIGVVMSGSIVFLFRFGKVDLFILGILFLIIFISGIYRIIRDTMKTQYENAEIRKQYGELLEIDREKSDFITVTSHQLRTPLTEIRWSVESAMRYSGLDDTTRMSLQNAFTGVSRLIGIVDEMFRARAVDQEYKNLKKEDVDLAKLVEEIIGSLDVLAHQKEVAISFTPPDSDITASIDKEKVKTAVKNVIDNAIRYSPRGSVDVFLRKEGDVAHVRVEDSGIGITREDYSLVFTRFFRGKNALLLQPDGSGVGLYTAKKIIEKHGGTISFISNKAGGTIFMVNVPLGK